MTRLSINFKSPTVFLTVILFIFNNIETKAQATYGGILGTVTDSTGAVVPDAKVEVTDTGRGITSTTQTNESGNYAVTQLTPGRYSIKISKQGFQLFVQQSATVSASVNVRVDAALQVGEQTQQVTVSGEPPGIATDRAEVQTTLSNRQVGELPVLNRNFTNLTLLVPGATLNTYQHAAAENPQQSTLVNTNGQMFSGTNYLLDGMNNNDAVLGIAMVNPPIDSVNEVNIATSNYDAEFTQAGGAVVRVETKSGTNDIHGSAFEFLQNNIFQSRDPLTQGLHDPGTPSPPNRGVPKLRWNQFGGTLGGPLVKNKFFLFGDYQGTRRRLGGSQTLRVPTAAERTGDLSDLGVSIYDPLSGNPDGSGRTEFLNGRIPTNRLSTPAVNLLNRLPLPNLTPADPGDNNYAVSAVEKYDSDQFDLRADHYVGEKLNYFARYSYLRADINAPGPLGLFGGPQFNNFGFSGGSNALNQSGTLSANYTFSPTLVANFRFGMSQYDISVDPLDIDENLADQIGIPGLNIPGRPDTGGLPRFDIQGTGGLQLGYGCNCPLRQRETLYDLITNWSKTAGNHTIKWGAQYELAFNRRLPSDDHRSGSYTFQGGVTSIAPSGGGTGLADFLLGSPSEFKRFGQISTNQQDVQNRMFYYVQDTWRVTPKLTLTYGLRWDTWFPDYSRHDGQGGRYDITDNFVRIPGVGGISKSGDGETQWLNLAPRVSFAYAFNDKTVLRAGYGRSYFQGTFGWTFNNIAADIYPSVIRQSIPTSSPFQAVFPLASAPPPVDFPAIPSNGLLPLPDGVSTSYIPANQKIPSVDQWNLTVERQLPGAINLSLAYVGNTGRHLNGGWNLNSAVPGPGEDINLNRPYFASYGITQTIGEKCGCTSSNYNALQVRAQKRFTSNLSFVASYTWSKTMDFGAFGLPTNQYNAASDYGPADFDRQHVFTLAHNYNLPFGKGQRWLNNAHRFTEGVLGGWQFNGITTVMTGLPFSPMLANNASLNSDMNTRGDLVGNPTDSLDQTRNLWYNPSAYAIPAPFMFGNAGRNSLRGPGLTQMDWSLFKNFAITERTHLQFRWEVFNVFNHTNLALPQNNVDTAQAGQITSITAPMRNMQFALRLGW